MRWCALLVMSVSAMCAQTDPKPADCAFLGQRVRVPAGGPLVHMWPLPLDCVGQFRGAATARLAGLPPKVSFTVEHHQGSRDTYKATWNSPTMALFVLFAELDAVPGEYPIRIVAEDGFEQHELEWLLVIQTPSTTVTSRLLPQGTKVEEKNTANAEGHKSVVLVLGLDNGLGMTETVRGAAAAGCNLMRQFARQLRDGLEPGRDTFGIIEAGPSFRVALSPTTDFDAGSKKASEEFSKIQCAGSANTLYAIERARELLKRPSLRETERYIVVTVSQHTVENLPIGLPKTITAKWPVRSQGDSRRAGNDAENFDGFQEIPLGPSRCTDTSDRIGMLRVDRANGLVGPLMPVARPAGPPASQPPADPQAPCAFSDPRGLRVGLDVAYMPETDLGGIPLDGPRRLLRFTDGPYKGKIRADWYNNSTTALRNLFDNLMRRLRDEGVTVIALYVNPYMEAGKLEHIGAKAPVSLVSIDNLDQMPFVLENVWATMGRTRRAAE